MTDRAATRQEHDSHGTIAVPADAYWGAQTARALQNFPSGGDRFPRALVHAIGAIKQACARTNAELGKLADPVAPAIDRAAAEVHAGELDEHVVAPVWQSGSGTQLNMNVNEVIAGRANELLGAGRGGSGPVHPNDHVNRSQSSNDVIPTAIHVAALRMVHDELLPALTALERTIAGRRADLGEVVKTGRTHLMDALPITVGHELESWRAQLEAAGRRLADACEALRAVPLGGTAVGTGLGAPPGFAAMAVDRLARIVELPVVPADVPLALQAAHGGPLALSAALRDLAVVLIRIAEDVRLLASGPRCGIGELRLPANEPGSSAMPGKVNPTQAESLIMIGQQVLGLDHACCLAATNGHLQLGTARPLLALNLLRGIRLLTDGMLSFGARCLVGLEVDEDRTAANLERSLMLVTALVPEIGHDRAAAVARRAHREGTTLREAAVADGAVSGERFDELVRPEVLARPHRPAGR
jgi:fumarate hydratase class II